MRRSAMLLAAATLPFLLSSCFVLNDFWVSSPTLSPGQKTKAYFALYPFSTSPSTGYQFVLVGVDDTAQLGIGKATWGWNGTFGGPVPMVARGTLDDALATPGLCTQAGLDFSTISGITWKGFTTATPVNDKGKVATAAMVAVGLAAKATASTDTRSVVMGVTGVWLDDGDGNVETDGSDSFYCTGISSSSTYIV